MEAVLEGGFSEPVLQSQSAFRAILDALANPGTVQELAPVEGTHAPLTAELVGTLLTLSDHDTPIWLAEALNTDEVAAFVGFHSGAPVVSEPGKAVFAFATVAGQLPPLDQFNLGTQEYPDRSTTIVLVVEALTGGDELITRGPGIKNRGHISPIGLPEDFVTQWAANRELFPRGVDLLLLAPGHVLGLPRTTRISEGH